MLIPTSMFALLLCWTAAVTQNDATCSQDDANLQLSLVNSADASNQSSMGGLSMLQLKGSGVVSKTSRNHSKTLKSKLAKSTVAASITKVRADVEKAEQSPAAWLTLMKDILKTKANSMAQGFQLPAEIWVIISMLIIGAIVVCIGIVEQDNLVRQAQRIHNTVIRGNTTSTAVDNNGEAEGEVNGEADENAPYNATGVNGVPCNNVHRAMSTSSTITRSLVGWQSGTLGQGDSADPGNKPKKRGCC